MCSYKLGCEFKLHLKKIGYMANILVGVDNLQIPYICAKTETVSYNCS